VTWLRRHWAGPASLLVHGAVIGAIMAQPTLPLPAAAPTLDLSLMMAAVEEAKETPPEKVTEVRPPETVQVVQPEMVKPAPLEPVRKVKPPPVPRVRVETVRAAEPQTDPIPQPPQPSAAPQIASTAPVAVSAPSPDYLARLLHALDRAKVYPHDAQRRHQEGTVMLRFSLDRQGRVPSYRIERSSGYALLDRAVAELVERAQPLPPPPEDVAGRELVVPVRFQLR
jgi:protein TonB